VLNGNSLFYAIFIWVSSKIMWQPHIYISILYW